MYKVFHHFHLFLVAPGYPPSKLPENLLVKILTERFPEDFAENFLEILLEGFHPRQLLSPAWYRVPAAGS